MGQSKDRRSDIEIVADILRLLRLGQASKIEIIHTSQISAEQASKYLKPLFEAGALEDSEERMGLPSCRITKKGLAILSQIENLREMFPKNGALEILQKSSIIEINVGQVLVTAGVNNLARSNKQFATFVESSLGRYRKGDWGEASFKEQQLNYLNQERGRLIFSSYEAEGLPEIWITTSPDRSYTSIMFSDEHADIGPLEPYWVDKRAVSPE